MEYIDVIWKHMLDDYPIRLVSELGDDRYECRKLHFFKNGTVETTDSTHETLRTGLGAAAVPAVDEINQDPEFEAMTISAADFEALWLAHAGARQVDAKKASESRVPPHLVSTWELLERAFPSGIAESDYLPTLVNLYPHMADENLAIVMAEFTGKPAGIVLNDVYTAAGGAQQSKESIAAISAQLSKAGFEEWVAQD